MFSKITSVVLGRSQFLITWERRMERQTAQDEKPQSKSISELTYDNICHMPVVIPINPGTIW